MMPRTRLTWLAAAACVAGVILALAWLTREAIDLERARRDAQRQAEFEETVRLALWRMDSAIGMILAEESNRPYFAYSSFYPAQRAYTNMFNEVRNGEVRIPSPLLTYSSPNILLHFQHETGGGVTSPQAPTGAVRNAALKGFLTPETLEQSESRLREFARLVPVAKVCETAQTNARQLAAATPPPKPAPNPPSPSALAYGYGKYNSPPQQDAIINNNAAEQTVAQAAQAQNRKSQTEYQRRAEVQEISGQLALNEPASQGGKQSSDRSGQQAPVPQMKGVQQSVQVGQSDGQEIVASPLRPVAINGQLLLVRHVNASGKQYVQGCWLNWPSLRATLLDQVKDLLPSASLDVVESDSVAEPSRMLATIPVRLQPGALPPSADATDVSALRGVLTVAWAAVIVAALAIGALLWGAMALSDRRAAFVSAVTHELRTPLTTFRLYTELLSEGRVSDEAKKGGYLRTLRAEAERLSHLVENVLSHARLERNAGRRGPRETVALRSVIERTSERLARRAEQAEFAFVPEIEPAAAEARVSIDALSVEQVLVNLVDNACKYAASAEDRRLHLAVERREDHVRIAVKDHGPGVAPDAAKRLFRAFSKSAREAAHTAPGIGLGLSLSRRLARAMGGDLTCESLGRTDGAVFVLTLPIKS